MSFAPSASEAEMEKAIARHKAGQLGDAEQMYRNVLKAEPLHPGANHNLGVVMIERGNAEQSLGYFRAALEADSATALYWLSYARALIAANHPDEAIAVLEQGKSHGLSGQGMDALMSQAHAKQVGAGTTDVGALYVQAVERHRAGRAAEAMALYRRVIAAKPNHIDAYDNLGNMLGAQGKFEEAAEVYSAALKFAPDNAEMLDNLGYALTAQGKIEEAIAAYRKAVANDPDFADAHYHLGSVLSENGRIAEGFEHYMRRAELVYGKGKVPAPAPGKPEPLHKIKHDREQRDYLAGGKASDDAPQVADMFRVADGSRLKGPAVNPANMTPELMEKWHGAWPQMVVIENFLMPEALAKLREYCAGSTIWRRLYDAGYIGATPPDGFACPLLAQIAEEIRDTYADIFGPHHFHYLGAFKYDSELSTGTNTHADFSAVNVNFYIAPDEANLDPMSGGMEIWDVEAKDEAEMRRYNSDEAGVRQMFKDRSAKSIKVAHKANRAVLFKSSFFHKTDDCTFAEGYLNKRINVSLLFGHLGAATK